MWRHLQPPHRPAVFRNPPDRLFVQPAGRPSVFSTARQPVESSRFSFGNTALQPARLAGPPISVILTRVEQKSHTKEYNAITSIKQCFFSLVEESFRSQSSTCS